MSRAYPVSGFSWSAALVSVFLTFALNSCGEDPAFKESTTPNTADGMIDPNPKTATDSDPSGVVMCMATNCTANNDGSSGEENGGSDNGITTQYPPVNGPYQPNNINTGNETAGNVTYIHDVSTLKTISKVDILWVVDSSGSMAEEQSYLGTNFRSFINSLSASNSDFQVGVTTTDICASQSPSTVAMNQRWCPTLDGNSNTHLRGSLVGDSSFKVLKPSMSDLTSRFTRYANVGIDGSSHEHGLKAAEMAVTKSLSGQNEGLVRSNSFLAVIVVSDEEDDGIGLGKTDLFTGINYIDAGMTSARYTDTDFINYMNANKGAGNYSLSTITGTRLANGRMCTSAHSQPQEEGTQYIAAAKKTGGIVQSICDTNWSTSLANIGRDINAQSSQILLSKIPYNGTVRVYVNGVENVNWTYTSASNSIKFNAGYVPAAGSTIDIAYWH